MIDVCDAHGAWFDANELREVARAYADRPRVVPSPVEGWVVIEGSARLTPNADEELRKAAGGREGWDQLFETADVALTMFGTLLRLLNLLSGEGGDD